MGLFGNIFKTNLVDWELIRTNVVCTKTKFNPMLQLEWSKERVIADLYQKVTKRGKVKYKWVEV